jgi:alkylhydroperoxidase family enzyme
MARIPLLTPEAVSDEALRALTSATGHLNIFRALAHAQTCIVPIMKLGQAVLTEQQLPARSRELMLLLTMSMERGEYEVAQHIEIALGVGASQAEVDAVLKDDVSNPIFSEADRALFAFARQVIRSARVDVEVFAAVRAHFSDREIVEAIIAMGFYSTLVRLTGALEVEIDTSQGMAVLNAAATRRPK